MAKKHFSMHLTAERIQAFLDGTLPKEEGADVQEHATFCARCQGELESWQLLYSELEELPVLEPSQGFAQRVLSELDIAITPEVAKVRRFGWLRRRAARTIEHLDAPGLQDYVEGLLPQSQMARVRTHLDTCRACHDEAAQWSALVRGLESLPVLVPSAGFAQRVMAQVRIGSLVRTPAAASLPRQVLAWAGRAVPRTQRAWAIISGVAVTPVTVVALLVYAVFSNASVTPAHLASFLWWKASGALSTIAAALMEGLFESAIMFQAYSVLEAMAGAPALVAMGAVSLAAATSLAGWVLYRNLITTPVDGHYATASV